MEGPMKKLLNLVLLLALATGTFGTTATAQAVSESSRRDQARIEFANFDPTQASGLLQQTAYRRCDGDHDRDDRACYVVRHDPHHDYRRSAGYYDRWGRWHPSGWYDRYGYWHPYR
jgi:hypothetical protein